MTIDQAYRSCREEKSKSINVGFGTNIGAICYCESRGLLATAHLDTIRITDEFTGRLLSTLSPTTQTEETEAQNRFDAQGFQSVVFDNVVAIGVSEEDNLTLCAVHRSGRVRAWALESTEESEKRQDNLVFTKKAAWRLPTAAGSPKFLEMKSKCVAVGTIDGRVYVYRASDGQQIHSFTHLFQTGDNLTTLRFSPSKQLLFAGSAAGEGFVFDLVRNCVVASLKGHTGAITDARFIEIKDATTNHMEPAVVTASRDKWLKVWTLSAITSKLLHLAPKAFRKEGRVAWGERLSAAEVTQTDSAKESKKRKGAVSSFVVNALRNHPTLHVLPAPDLSLRTQEELEAIIILTAKMLKGKVQTSASWVVASGGNSGSLRLWDMLTKKEIPLSLEANDFFYRFPSAPIARLLRSVDGSVIVAIGNDQSAVKFVDLEPVSALLGSTGISSAHSVACEEETKVAIFSITVLGSVQRVTLEVGENAQRPSVRMLNIGTGDEETETEITCLDVAPDNSLVAFSTREGETEVRDAEGNGVLHGSISGALTGPLTHLKLSRKPLKETWPSTLEAGAPFVVTCGQDKFMRVWKLQKESGPIDTADSMVKVSEKSLYCIEVSPNNKIIATGGADKKVKLWSTTDLSASPRVLQGHKQPVTALAFSPTEQVIASASLDTTVRLWNTSTTELIYTLTGADASVSTLSFTHNGARLVAGCSDGSVHLWDCKKGTHLGSSQRHQAHVTSIRQVSARKLIRDEDGDDAYIGDDLLLSCDQEGNVFFWNDETQAVQEENQKQERERREDVANMDILLRKNEWSQAIRIALKWRRIDLFEKIVWALQDRLTGDLADELPSVDDLLATSKEDMETLLMAALHFSKSHKSAHVAQWIVNLLLRSTGMTELSAIPGFDEFCVTHKAVSSVQIARLEKLREKAFLVEYILNDLPNITQP